MKYLCVIPVCFFALACGFASKQQAQSAETEADKILDTITSDAVATLTPHIVPSVEDTVKQQLGGELYFLRKEKLQPSDSITVIKTSHHNSDEYGNYRQYSFIVHNKKSQFHKYFTTTSLRKEYKAYVVDDPDLPYRYSEDAKERYDKDLAEQKKAVGKARIDPAIKDYIGHWIYLKVYDGQFYINHEWAWLPSFHISEDAITNHYMDGLYPSVIRSFVKEENGDLLIEVAGDEDSVQRYELVDKELNVYSVDGDYVVPAKNVHRFKIVEHANNTGDLLVSGRWWLEAE